MHITFDLETLGNTTKAPIVQIGAVKFDDNGVIHSEFLQNVKLSSLEKYNFEKWIGKTGDYIYWSHCTFDPPILRYNIKQANLMETIPFRLHKDIRTLNYLVGDVYHERKGIAHNALDDCRYQASYITKMLNKFKNN